MKKNHIGIFLIILAITLYFINIIFMNNKENTEGTANENTQIIEIAKTYILANNTETFIESLDYDNTIIVPITDSIIEKYKRAVIWEDMEVVGHIPTL